ALLKTLEEPPPHVVFIFATTEPHKVPATILSRCQRFDFKRMPLQVIIEQLKLICEDEKIEIDDESLLIIAKKADGSMRDAQSILDQIISFAGNKVVVDDVLQALGVIHQDLYFEFTDILKSRSVEKALDFIERFISQGYDIAGLLIGLAEHFRNKLFVLATDSVKLLEVSESGKKRYLEEKGDFSEQDLLRFIQIISETEVAIKRSPNPRLKLEIMAVKLIKMERSVTIGDLVDRLAKLNSGKTGAAFEPRPSKPAPADLFNHTKSQTQTKTPPPAQAERSMSPAPSAQPQESVKKETNEEAGEDGDEPSSSFVNESQANYEAKPVITLAEIQDRWDEVLAAIKRKKMTLGFFLQEGFPSGLHGNVLEIVFDASNGFHLKSVQKEQKIIQQVLENLLGLSLSLKFSKGNLKKNEDKKNSNGEHSGITDIKRNGLDPRVQKILKMFDGELL
ncbi:MAG TPA: hypothetical protein ENG82_00365, partial [Bacteroidetes bacterium]|nr:hypothetical protein [Bacteroidota bacterium]